LRDAGLIQLYVESSQEAYDTHIAAFKIAEDPNIMLPVLVCMDGWILTHSYERVSFLAQNEVDSFLPPFKPENFLDVNDPKSWGSYAEEDVFMEFKYAIQKSMQYGKKRIKEIFSELTKISGRDYGGLIEPYRTEHADIILIAMGSMVGTIKDTIDKLWEHGQRIGLVKIRCYRPFPFEDILEAISTAKVVAVLDANFSMGSEGALGMDLKAKLYGRPGAPFVVDFVAGLGGREVNEERIIEIVDKAEEIRKSGMPLGESYWVGLNPEIVS
jgi:pyruvate ferredoxin oxidoreductase alpha subunit